MSNRIPYYDAADSRLLGFLNDHGCAEYLRGGVAKAVTTKKGEIVRMYRLHRERAYSSAHYIHAASQTTDRLRNDQGVIIAPPVIRQHK